MITIYVLNRSNIVISVVGLMQLVDQFYSEVKASVPGASIKLGE